MTGKRILAVASIGGHWVQLLRITKELENTYEVVYCCTNEACAKMVPDRDFYVMEDFNRKNIWKLLPAFFRQVALVKKLKPKAVITTGAAPGLSFILAAKVCGVKTIWVDSVANVDRMSASGSIAKRIASRTYVQWHGLAQAGVTFYEGNVFGV